MVAEQVPEPQPPQVERFMAAANVCRDLLQTDPFEVMKVVRGLHVGHEKRPDEVTLELVKSNRVQITMEYVGGWIIKLDTKPREKPAGSMATSEIEFADYDGTSVKAILFGEEHTRINSGGESVNIAFDDGDQVLLGSFSPEMLRFLESSASFATTFMSATGSEENPDA